MGSVRRGLHALFIAIAAIGIGVPMLAHAGGDTTADRAKRLACQACHTMGDPISDAPGLAGQRQSYLAAQLKAFKAGERKNPFMSAIAVQLSDADIAGLAAYWTHQPVRDTAVPEAAAAIQRSRAPFPKDFPRGFVLYLTSNDPERKTVNNYYINTIGFEAARAARPLPEGTVIVASHSSARLGPDKRPVTDNRGRWTINKLEEYATMETRPGWGDGIPELVRNANWNYSAFTADKQPRTSNQAMCLACHKPQAAVDYLFSFKELRDKAAS